MFFFFMEPWHWESGSIARAVMRCRVPATSIIDFKPLLFNKKLMNTTAFFVRHAPARAFALMEAIPLTPFNHQL